MLVRVLTMKVLPDRVEDWMRYTKDIGFPGMLAQPGCRNIWRLHRHGDGPDYQVVTVWDSLDDLNRFKASEAMKDLSAKAAGLTTPPYAEVLYDLIPD